MQTGTQVLKTDDVVATHVHNICLCCSSRDTNNHKRRSIVNKPSQTFRQERALAMDDGLVGEGHGGGGGGACEGEQHISGAVSSSGSSNAEATEPPSSSKRTQAQASLCSSSPELNNTSSSESSRSETSSKSHKKRKGNGKKLDRSKLRKGKWTVSVVGMTSFPAHPCHPQYVTIDRRRRIYISHYPLLQHRAPDIARGRNVALLPCRETQL